MPHQPQQQPEPKPTVDITITADTQTANAVLSAIEQLAEDETVDPTGIQHVSVKPTDYRDLID